MNILTNALFKKGNQFEQLIYDEIEKRFGKKSCVDVISDYKECCLEKMDTTINYMSIGIPIIKQAVLYNETNKSIANPPKTTVPNCSLTFGVFSK